MCSGGGVWRDSKAGRVGLGLMPRVLTGESQLAEVTAVDTQEGPQGQALIGAGERQAEPSDGSS